MANLAKIRKGWVRNKCKIWSYWQFVVKQGDRWYNEIWHARACHVHIHVPNCTLVGLGELYGCVKYSKMGQILGFCSNSRDMMHRLKWNLAENSTPQVQSCLLNFPLMSKRMRVLEPRKFKIPIVWLPRWFCSNSAMVMISSCYLSTFCLLYHQHHFNIHLPREPAL